MPIELCLKIFDCLAVAKDWESSQSAMKVNWMSRKSMGGHCRTLDTDAERGLDGFPRYGKLKTLRFEGFVESLRSFIGGEQASDGRLSLLETLVCTLKEAYEGELQQIGASLLENILSVAPKLNRLEFYYMEHDESFFEVFGEGCGVTSLVIHYNHHDGDLRHLKSIVTLDIKIDNYDSPYHDDLLLDLLALPRLEHVTFHDLRLDEDHRRAPCRWKTLTLVSPDWKTLNRVPSAVLLKLDSVSHWQGPWTGVEECIQFGLAVKTFLDLAPDRPFPYVYFDATAEVDPATAESLVNLLMPLFLFT